MWSEETAALAREHNDANVISVGGRMHTLEEMTRFIEVFLDTPYSGEERHDRRIGMLADYEKTGNLPPLPESALGRGREGSAAACPRATPSTGSPRRSRDRFAGRAVAVSSPQGRFAESAALLDGTRARRTPRPGASTCSSRSRAAGSCTSTSGSTASSTCTDGPAPAPVGPGPAAAGSAGTAPARPSYADLRGATACELLTERAAARASLERLGPDPLRADADPDRGLGSGSAGSRTPIGDAADGPVVLAGVGNVYRAEVLFRHRMHPLRPGNTLRRGQFEAIWDDLVALMREGVAHRPDRHRPRRAHARGDGPRRRARTTTGERSTSTAAHGQPCHVCGARVRTEVLAARNLFWCPRCQPRFRSRAGVA